MKQLVSEGIILSRTDYGEADRIITLLTPQQGKLRLIAKGVRRVKSKLAGGVELFSVSTITYIQGRKDLGTLISARLNHHYGCIVKDIRRTMTGYELIKRLDKATEDQPEEDYYDLLQSAFESLDDSSISLELLRLWFMMQLLRLGGHAPNLEYDTLGKRLQAGEAYSFSFEDMTFAITAQGPFLANHIKFLRLGFAGYPPKALAQVRGGTGLAEQLMPLVQSMLQTHIRS